MIIVKIKTYKNFHTILFIVKYWHIFTQFSQVIKTYFRRFLAGQTPLSLL